MGINGLLTDVRWEWTGTELTADLLAGATVLPVLDPESITEEEFVWIAGTGPYEIIGVDVDAATFTITPGLSIDVDSGTEVANDIGGQPGRAWVCEVILADAERPVEVPLTIHDLAVMPEGTYDPPATIILSDDLEKVENLPGSMPVISGEYIPPESLPTPEIPDLSDGIPPSGSPTPDATGGVGVLHLRWNAITNHDPVTYDVHVSTVNDFAPDNADVSTTRVASTDATAITIKTLPDGSPLAYGPEGSPLLYYVKIVARDVDPGFAPASAQDSASLYRVSNTEISASYAYFGSVSATQITTGTLSAEVTLSGVVQTADAGQRAVMDPQGLHLFDPTGQPIVDLPTDPSKYAEFRGKASMSDLTTAALSINQSASVVSGATVTLQGNITPPSQGPSVVLDHEVGSVPIYLPNPYPEPWTPLATTMYIRGACCDATNLYLATEIGPVATTSNEWGLHKIPLNTTDGRPSLSTQPMDYSYTQFRGIALDRGVADRLWRISVDPSSVNFKIRRYTTTDLTAEGSSSEYTTPWSSSAYYCLGMASDPSAINSVWVGLVSKTSPYNAYIGRFTTDATPPAFTLSSVLAAPWPTNSSPNLQSASFQFGRFDFTEDGAYRAIFAVNGTAYVWTSTVGALSATRKSTEDFLMGSDGGVGGRDGFFWCPNDNPPSGGFRQILSVIPINPAGSPETNPAPWKTFTNIRGPYTSSGLIAYDNTWYASFTWRDSQGTIHETPEGKRTQFTMLARHRVNLSVPVGFPGTGGIDDPDSVSFYAGPNINAVQP